MNKKQEAQMREALKPIAAEISELFLKAMSLRIDVHLVMAFEHGAEAEDFGEVVARAIDSALPVVSQMMDKLGEVEKASAIGKAKAR